MTRQPRNDRAAASRSVNCIAAAWLAIAVATLLGSRLAGIGEHVFPLALAGGLAVSAASSIGGLLIARYQADRGPSALLLHVGNLATVGGVVVASVLQLLAHPL